MNLSDRVRIRSGSVEARRASWKVRHEFIGLLFALADGALIFCASIFADLGYDYFLHGGTGHPEFGAATGLVAVAIFWLSAWQCGLYRLPHLIASQPRWSAMLFSWGAVVLVLPPVLFLKEAGSIFSRVSMIIFACLGLVLLVGFRMVASPYLRRLMRKGWIAGRRAVVIGEADELGALNALSLFYRFGIEETARVPLRDVGEGTPSRDDIADVDRAVDLARDTGASEIVVALNWSHTALLQIMKERVRRTPLPVRLLPDHNIRSIIGGRHSAALAIELQREPLTKMERAIKRALDICLASAILLMLGPLLVMVAVAIKLDSPGPGIFFQRRNGFNGREFIIYKFRTMNVLEDGPVIRQATRRDARVTGIGRVLRQSGIDEWPQLFNVLKGDMSLVGPRPHAIYLDDEYKTLIANYAFRHHVKPGITGLAQVNGCRGETLHLDQMKKRIQFDLWYIDKWSVLLDLRILLIATAHAIGLRGQLLQRGDILERAENPRVDGENVYSYRTERNEILNQARELLRQNEKRLAEAVLADGDSVGADNEISLLQADIPELFCCRTLSDGFATSIVALHHALQNRRGVPLTTEQIRVVLNLIHALEANIFLPFAASLDLIDSLADADLNTDPPEADFLGDIFAQ